MLRQYILDLLKNNPLPMLEIVGWMARNPIEGCEPSKVESELASLSRAGLVELVDGEYWRRYPVEVVKQVKQGSLFA